MFKRTNKITSLLVVAAAVISIVPAYASDVKKIESQDGTVYNAVAYKDGEFYVDGEIDNKDEASYYLASGKYNDLSDITAGSDVSAYGTKYVEVQGGDYYVDLSNGKTTSDSIGDNARDDASSNLRKKVKADTDGRYMKDGLAGAADYLQTFDSTYQISGAKFGDVWYATKLTNKDATNGYSINTAAGAGTADLNVFTDGNGNYIDADYNIGKIKITTTCSGVSDKSVYIENTNDTYDSANGGTVSAYVRQNKVIGQDKDYIYRTATVTVVTAGSGVKISAVDGKAVSLSAFNPSADGKTVNFDVIQKISKAQSSSDIGGAKYAKNVETYVICDSDAKTETFAYDNYTIANGKVIGYDTDKTTTSNNVKVQTGTLKSSDGLYYVDLASSSTEDAEVYDSNTVAVEIDADGNLWRLNGGYVYQWNNDADWDKVYKVDGSFNQFSVYDKDNIVAWNQSDEVYSVIGGKTATDTTTDTTADSTTTATTQVAAKGWVKAADGTWAYNKADGTKAIGWLQDGATWYYLNTNGVMKTGWINDNGTWYYLNASGAMQTGWINDNGTWYYCNVSGAMLANTVVDGYILGANGAWIR